MAIFHGYVSLPEGIPSPSHGYHHGSPSSKDAWPAWPSSEDRRSKLPRPDSAVMRLRAWRFRCKKKTGSWPWENVELHRVLTKFHHTRKIASFLPQSYIEIYQMSRNTQVFGPQVMNRSNTFQQWQDGMENPQNPKSLVGESLINCFFYNCGCYL